MRSRWIVMCAGVALALLPVIVHAAAPKHRPAHAASEPTVISWSLESPDSLNAALEAATREPWARDPLQIALRVLGTAASAIDERRDVSVRWKAEVGEDPATGILTIVQDGLEDDSIGAMWDQLRLRRAPDRSWRVAEHRAAQRCARPGSPNVFGRTPCP